MDARVLSMAHKGKIGGVVGLFEDMLEIAAGWCCLNEAGRMEFLSAALGQVFSLTS